MNARFAHAAAAALECPGGSLRVVVAERFRLRLLGLMRLGTEQIQPLLFTKCSSIHTFGMKTPIDVVWLELDGEEAQVVGVAEFVPPRRWARAPRGAAPRRAIAALELVAGDASRLGLTARGSSAAFWSL